MPTPTVFSTMNIDELDEFLLELEEHDKEITAGVAAIGPAAAYASVWEWGNLRQVKSGPRTVLGMNPEGKEVWLSAQAPFGFIRINENAYWDALKLNLGKVQFKDRSAKGITEELELAATRTMKLAALIIADAAPVDTGELRDSIHPVLPGDYILDNDEDDELLGIG